MPFTSLVARRRLLATGALVATGLLPLTANAQAGAAARYPERPVKIVVGFSPGGATDILARLMADRLSTELGQPFVVDNRPGAGSNIATEAVVRSKPDGYTLLLMTIQNATNVSVYRNMTFDVERDLTPIAQLMASPSVLVASPALKVNTLAELLALAKKDPKALSYASTGTGGSPHLAGEMLKMRTGIDMVHVPYKGTMPALTDVMGGIASVTFLTTLGVLDQMTTGKVKPLAVAYTTRLPELPDVPTMAEAGLPGFEVTSWNGLAVPAGTPQPVVDKLSAAVAKILRTPDMQARIKGLGGQLVDRTPDQFSRFFRSEVEKWRGVVKAANITID